MLVLTATLLILTNPALPLPQRSTVFSVTSFGADASGKRIATRAIQGAIDAAERAGGGTVDFSAGTFRSGTVQLKSGVTLHLQQGATLKGSSDLSHYQRGNWPALIIGTNCKNIKITGLGKIDGNSVELEKRFAEIKTNRRFLEYFPTIRKGEKLSYIGPTGNPTELDPYAMNEAGKLEQHLYGSYTRPSEIVRPQVIELRKCVGVTIQDITLADSANWVQTYRDCEEMKFHRVKVRSTKYWNNDGLDLVDCRRVEIYDCDFDSADDALCLKSEPFGAGCSDIVASRLKLASRASAIKFGTASHIGFKRIYISDVVVRDTYRSAVAIQSVDGAEIEDVTVERLKATNTGNAIFVRLGHRNKKRSPGYIRRIRLRDFDVQVPPLPKDYHREIGEPHNLIPASIAGIPGYPVQDVVAENIKISYGGGGNAGHANVPLDRISEIPEKDGSYPEFSMWGELPAWALYVRHADGITFRNSTFGLQQPDFRPAFVTDDASRLTLDKVLVSGNAGELHGFFKDSPQKTIKDITCTSATAFNYKSEGGDTSKIQDSRTPAWVDPTQAEVYRAIAQLQSTLRPWVVPDQVFSVTQFGAIPDGKTISTAAIQRAIDKCHESGGGVVLLQGGDFVSGTIDLRSNVMLEVSKGSRLLGSLNQADYPDRVPKTFTVMDSNMNLRQSLIYAERCKNIGIRGEGQIDGRGSQKNFPGPTTITAVTGRPFLMRIIECENVTVTGITLKDAASWMQNYLACSNVILDSVTVDSHVNGNNDGIDIDGCRNVIIRNCKVRSGDDAMCFKAASMRPTENVLVENSDFFTYCNALKFGTDTQADFRNVLVRNCRLGGIENGQATSGITWATVDGGNVQNIICEDIDISRAGSPIFIRRGSRGRTIPGNPRPVTGQLERVILRNITGKDNGARGSMISGVPGFPVRDLLLSNITLDAAGDAPESARTIQVPEGETGYPDAGWFGVKHFPAFGFFFRHAEGIHFDRVTVTPRKKDPREFMHFGNQVTSTQANGLGSPPTK